MVEKKVFYKGREIMSPKGFPDEIIKDERQRIFISREHTKRVKNKNQKEKQKLSMIAGKYSFGELLVSNIQTRPGVEPNFPTIVTIPEWYPAKLCSNKKICS